jgi:predicted  nucleic acid-binding Zn-ribbon protein
VDKLNETAADIAKRSKELSQQVADYNDRIANFDRAPPSGPTGERQRRALERDKATLDKAAADLEAERAALGPNAEQLAKTYQARVEQRNIAADDLNKRSAALGKTINAHEDELANWKSDCEGRPYREDDEKALKAGK